MNHDAATLLDLRTVQNSPSFCRPKLVYGFLVHLPFYVVNLPTILPLFLAGHFLYCAKLIPLSNVSNMWLRLYTGIIPMSDVLKMCSR